MPFLLKIRDFRNIEYKIKEINNPHCITQNILETNGNELFQVTWHPQ